MSRILMGLLAGLALSLVSITPAVAAASTGAQVINYNYCQPDGDGTLCANGHSVYNTTTTPSGNISLIFEDYYHYSVDAPGCHYDNTGQDHGNTLIAAGDTQQSHGVQFFDFNTSCFGAPQHCTFYSNIAIANGQVRAVKYEYICEPV